MKESEHLVTLAQKLWDTDHVLFARGLLWESSGFKEPDGSGGSRETPKSLSDTSFKLLRTGFLGGQVPGRQDGSKRTTWSYPNPEPCRREVEHPNSD